MRWHLPICSSLLDLFPRRKMFQNRLVRWLPEIQMKFYWINCHWNQAFKDTYLEHFLHRIHQFRSDTIARNQCTFDPIFWFRQLQEMERSGTNSAKVDSRNATPSKLTCCAGAVVCTPRADAYGKSIKPFQLHGHELQFAKFRWIKKRKKY